MSATYGQLMAATETAVLATHHPAPVDAVLVDDAGRLLRALARHTAMLVPLGLIADDDHDAARDRAARRLREALDPAAHHRPPPRDPAAPASAWHDAARALDLAAQILTQHLDLRGAGSTPHTADLLDPDQRWAALGRLAVLGRAIARRVEDTVGSDPTVRAPDRRRLLYVSDPLTARATHLLDLDLGQGTRPVPDRLEQLTAPPDLTRPGPTGHDGPALAELVERVLLAAHRQAHGERRTSRADLLGYALLATELRRHQLDHDNFPSDLARQHALRSHRAWTAIAAQWQDLHVADISPQGTRDDLTHALHILSTPPPAGVAPGLALAVEHGCRKLLALAGYSRQTVATLAARGLLLQPTRQRDDIDCPRPWTTSSPERDQALDAAYARALHTEGMRTAASAATAPPVPLRRATLTPSATRGPSD